MASGAAEETAEDAKPAAGSVRLADGQIMTANSRGFDMGKPSYRWEAWVDSYDGQHPLVDIGCGYGTNVHAALRRSPGLRVRAFDMAQEHLDCVRSTAAEAIADGRLTLKWGKLPDEVELSEASASGILIAQVLHFLSPEDVVKSLSNACRWLIPGGRVVVLVISHYQRNYVESGRISSLLAEAEDPSAFPGWVPDSSLTELKDLPAAAPCIQTFNDTQMQATDLWKLAAGAVPCLNTFSEGQMRLLAERAGLEVEECCLCPGRLSNYPEFLLVPPDSPYANKEQIVLVARRPLPQP